jgi:hypothetical protein
MSFIVGVMLFALVVGLLDRRIPWPTAPRADT